MLLITRGKNKLFVPRGQKFLTHRGGGQVSELKGRDNTVGGGQVSELKGRDKGVGRTGQ